MKIPLRYQATEFDCGPTAVLNAISFLYDIEEIPPDFVKRIYEVGLDNYGRKLAYHGGTSTDAMRYLAAWFTQYAQRNEYPLKVEFYAGGDISLKGDSPILKCLREGGAAVVRCVLETDHYITLTGIEGRFVHVFDPYYEEDEDYRGVTFVHDRPKEMNRLVDMDIMDCNEQCDYAFCRLKDRSAMLLWRTDEISNNEISP